MTQAPDQVLQAVLSSGVSLPAPNPSLLRLQASVADEKSGPRDLADIVRKDPVLTGTLMRVANSPVFRPRTQARSVIDAISMLGRTKMLAIAMSAALRSQAEGIDQVAVNSVWTRCANVAEWTYRAAQLSRNPGLADLAYLAALVHDVGVPVLLRRFPQQVGPFNARINGVDAAALELDTATEAGHSAVGCIVARNWKLPMEVAEAIRVHHAPEAAKTLDPLTLNLAILIALGRRVIDGPTAEWTEWQPLAETQLGIDAQVVETLTQLRDG